MGKLLLIGSIFSLVGFSQILQAAIINVASIEFTTSSLKTSEKLNLSEVILIEEGTGFDLALASAGAQVSFTGKSKKKNKPGYVIDGLVKKKQSFRFLENKKNILPSLTIDLAQVSSIDTLSVFGKLAKSKKDFLGVNFLDSNGNSLYQISNLSKVFGKKVFSTNGNTVLVLPDLSGSNPGAVSAVPVPASAWLFGSGLMGLVGISRRALSKG